MKTLNTLYEKPSAFNKVFFMKHSFYLKISKGGYVVSHLDELNSITSQLRSMFVNFDDEVQDLLILCSLSESWDSLVMAMSNSIFGTNTLVFDDDVGVILSEKM